MVTHDHGNTFKIIREALVVNGYYIKWKVLNGKDYGIFLKIESVSISLVLKQKQLDDFSFLRKRIDQDFA